ncbi:MAG: hypothetical protein AAFO69_05450 [Bacteroidota bacterium]
MIQYYSDWIRLKARQASTEKDHNRFISAVDYFNALCKTYRTKVEEGPGQ